MREFLLVVPDLMLAGSAAPAAAEPGILALRFGAAAWLAGGWRAWMARRLDCPLLAERTIAAVVANALPGGAGESVGRPAGAGRPWLATPLHFVAGLEALHLPGDGILSLEPAERAELSAGFAARLGEGRLALIPVSGDTFVLRGLDLPEAVTVEPFACLGADLSGVQATGPGATPLRRLMAELEMWLHDHPLNLRRAARGLRPVRSLWLWGGEAPSRSAARPDAMAAVAGTAAGADAAHIATHSAADARLDRVFSDDAWLRAACGIAGIGLAAEDASPDITAGDESGAVLATARFAASGFGQLESFERRHLAPAVAALASGRLGRLTVVAADRLVTVAASDRYRLWRPRRPWLAALNA